MKKGSITDTSGFSGDFSWWRNNNDYRIWTICGLGPFTRNGRAVVDDFGTLVEVKE